MIKYRVFQAIYKNHSFWSALLQSLKLASSKEEQRPDRSNAAVLAHVAHSGRSDAALR